jgi:fatty-acid peroxygenase
LFQSAATIGPQHWQGRRARGKSEQWIEALIHLVRSGEFHPRKGTALHVFANYRDRQGKLLDESVAAVEVLNIIRPMVAISVYISFLAHGLHHYPEERQKLVIGQDKDLGMFVQEVRRFYPFFPFATARVKRDFRWQDYGFEENTLTLLDLYGTNHDPRIWQNPELYEPARFADWDGSPFGLIPPGGGDHFRGHRCAGEWATIAIMKVSLDYLVNCMEYDVPPQDLSYSLVSAPSRPKSGMVITNIRRR